MTKNHDYSEFPDIHKYAQLENLRPEILVKAFRLEAHYHDLLLREQDFEQRARLYDDFYSELIPLYGRTAGPAEEDRSKDKYVKLFRKELEGKRIADFGCGQGHMLLAINRLLETKGLTGIDVVFPEELKKHKEIDFVEANLMTHQLKEPIDVAFSDNVLEHLVPEDAAIHLKNIYDNLNPGGKLIIIMPNRLFGPWDVTRIKDFSQSGKLAAEGGHVNESTHYEMVAQLKAVGFQQFSTIMPIPKLKYWLFSKMRTGTGWIAAVERKPWLLKLIKAMRYKGVCLLSFPVTLVATK